MPSPGKKKALGRGLDSLIPSGYVNLESEQRKAVEQKFLRQPNEERVDWRESESSLRLTNVTNEKPQTENKMIFLTENLSAKATNHVETKSTEELVQLIEKGRIHKRNITGHEETQHAISSIFETCLMILMAGTTIVFFVSVTALAVETFM